MKVTRIESGQVTVVVTWHVRPGCEQEFDAWFRDVSAAELKFPGHLGLNVVHHDARESEYVIVFRFDTDEHLKAWMNSDIRRDFLKKSRAVPGRKAVIPCGTGLGVLVRNGWS
jgi:antibiotic biosynthesis monooxygenase (ABM) superfamily enzyme